jgi:hypothetical protein
MAKAIAKLSTAAGTEVLFFDLLELDELYHVRRVVCAAKKHPHNPVMVQGDIDKWDSAQASPWAIRTVIYDEEEKLFKCWYNGTDAGAGRLWYAGYATSQDGVRWVKPDLGVFEFEGNKNNNIFHSHVWASVIKQKAEKDPAKRYRMHGKEVCWFSPDGIHWGEKVRFPISFPGPRSWDPVVFIEDDMDPDPRRRFKYIWQAYVEANKPGPTTCRAKFIGYSPDGYSWWFPKTQPFLSPNDSFEQENHFLMLVPYKGHYVTLYECGWYQPDGTSVFGAFSGDIRLAHSRDCEHFTRLDYDHPVIPRGGFGDWDGQFIVISDKAVIKDDTIYLYYCGQGNDWTSWPPSNGNSVPGNRFATKENPHLGTGNMRLSRMGLATLRLDGFTCMEVPDGQSFGHFTTKTMTHEQRRGGRLIVNLGDTQDRRSWLQVEVLDGRTRKPIPGFTRGDCPPILDDGVRVPVRWKGGDIGSLQKDSIRLRFWLYGAAKLYAVKFM